MDKYEYNPNDILEWNSEPPAIFTFKGHVKASPNEVVSIKIFADADGSWKSNPYCRIYEEVQKLKSQENDGLITIVEQ